MESSQTGSGGDGQEAVDTDGKRSRKEQEAVLQRHLDSLVQGGSGHPGLSSHEATVQVCDWQRVARQDVARLGGMA